MDEQAKINKDTITKFKAKDKVLENIDSKVTEVRSSNHQVLNMMKMLETQMGQLAGRLTTNEGKPSTVSLRSFSGVAEDFTSAGRQSDRQASSSLSLLGFSDVDFAGVESIGNRLRVLARFSDLCLFLGLLVNSLV
jgi:hypothetical protein